MTGQLPAEIPLHLTTLYRLSQVEKKINKTRTDRKQLSGNSKSSIGRFITLTDSRKKNVRKQEMPADYRQAYGALNV